MINRNKKNTLLLALATFFLVIPFLTRADIASYTLEQGIPFVGGKGQTLSYDNFSALFQKFITAVYIIAAVAAFIKIFLAGLKWYTSSGSSKAISQAKEDIKNALMGLAFLFLAGTLLVFINPNLNKISSIFIGDIKATPTVTPVTGTLATMSNNSGYYANPNLVAKLNDITSKSGLIFKITTACTKNDGTCDPNYCKNDCHPCIIGGSSCTPLTNVSCHFNGTCVDLIPNYITIDSLNYEGLDVLDESKPGCGESTGAHLHVSIPGSFTPLNISKECWFTAAAYAAKH